MPVNKNLAQALQKKYGKEKGTSVYYAMENLRSKAFQKGLKTAKREGHTVAHMKNLKKK